MYSFGGKKKVVRKMEKNYGFSFIRSNVYCTNILHIMKHFG